VANAAGTLPSGFAPSPLAGVSPLQVPYTSEEQTAGRAMAHQAYVDQQSNAMKALQATGSDDPGLMEQAAEDAAQGNVEAARDAAESQTPMGEFMQDLGAIPYEAAARGFKSAIVGAPAQNTGEGIPGLESDVDTNPQVQNAQDALTVMSNTNEPSPGARNLSMMNGIAGRTRTPKPQGALAGLAAIAGGG
jgi:hypothetical protein